MDNEKIKVTYFIKLFFCQIHAKMESVLRKLLYLKKIPNHGEVAKKKIAWPKNETEKPWGTFLSNT